MGNVLAAVALDLGVFEIKKLTKERDDLRSENAKLRARCTSLKAIFVVSAGVDYEGSSPIKGFATEDAADKFANRCHEYDAKRPAWPGMDDDDAMRERKMARQDRWRKKHPAGEDHSSSDYYNVAEIPFIEGQQ